MFQHRQVLVRMRQVAQPKRASTTSLQLAEQRQSIQDWAGARCHGIGALAALQREQGYSGSYSAVGRIPADIRSNASPKTTCRLHFKPGDAVQVDFGA